MVDLGFRPFDADNHYYEAEDAFIRHIDPAMAKRCMQWADVGGKRRLLVGGKINKFIPNPTFDPIARPGSLEDYFRGRNEDGLDMKTMFGGLEPIADHPGYRRRDARVALLDEQGLEGALLFPTLGVGMQEALRHDLPALHAAFNAFNTWLDEDWGFDRGDGRLYAAPMIAFADPELAAAEVARVLGLGARILVAIPGPVPDGDGGYVSPGHPRFDPVWALIAEAGVPLALHAGLSGVSHYGSFWKTGAERRGRVLGVQARGVPAGGVPGPGHLRHVRRPHLPRRAGAVPDAAAGVDRERGDVGARPAAQPAATPGARCPSPSPTTPSTSSASRCGSPPSTRTTWRCSRTCSASTGCCSARTSPTPRACPSRRRS